MVERGWGATVGAGVAGALIGALGTLVSGVMTYWSHQGDIDTKLIELSIGILQAEPKPETTSLREWAINTLQVRGKFNFAQNESSALLKNQLQVRIVGGPQTAEQQQQTLQQLMLMLFQLQQKEGARAPPPPAPPPQQHSP